MPTMAIISRYFTMSGFEASGTLSGNPDAQGSHWPSNEQQCYAIDTSITQVNRCNMVIHPLRLNVDSDNESVTASEYSWMTNPLENYGDSDNESSAASGNSVESVQSAEMYDSDYSPEMSVYSDDGMGSYQCWCDSGIVCKNCYDNHYTSADDSAATTVQVDDSSSYDNDVFSVGFDISPPHISQCEDCINGMMCFVCQCKYDEMLASVMENITDNEEIVYPISIDLSPMPIVQCSECKDGMMCFSCQSLYDNTVSAAVNNLTSDDNDIVYPIDIDLSPLPSGV